MLIRYLYGSCFIDFIILFILSFNLSLNILTISNTFILASTNLFFLFTFISLLYITFEYSFSGKNYRVTEWERLIARNPGEVGTAYYHLFDPANASMSPFNNLWNIPVALISGFFCLGGLVAILAAVSNYISIKQYQKKKAAEATNENNPD